MLCCFTYGTSRDVFLLLIFVTNSRIIPDKKLHSNWYVVRDKLEEKFPQIYFVCWSFQILNYNNFYLKFQKTQDHNKNFTNLFFPVKWDKIKNQKEDSNILSKWIRMHFFNLIILIERQCLIYSVASLYFNFTSLVWFLLNFLWWTCTGILISHVIYGLIFK